MKIDYQKIQKDLKLRGKILSLFFKNSGKGLFKFQNKFRFFLMRPPKGLDAKSVWVEGGDGAKMRLRILQTSHPEKSKNRPAILWIHGGGYATGTPELNGGMMKRLIEESGAVVVAPDYRLSLEESYPAALDDCYLALKWLKEHSAELGAASNQLMLGGESAGGGLAIAVALLAKEKKEVNVAFLMPIYPMIDDRPTKSSKNNDAPGWNSHQNREAWKLYLGELYGTEKVPHLAAPARVVDVSGLPPAVTFVGDLDPFLDETVDFFERMNKAGIPAKCRVYKGCYHGFDAICPNAEVSKEAVRDFLSDFRFAVLNYFNEQEN